MDCTVYMGSTVGCITIRIVGCTTTSNVVWLTTVWDIIQTLFHKIREKKTKRKVNCH